MWHVCAAPAKRRWHDKGKRAGVAAPGGRPKKRGASNSARSRAAAPAPSGRAPRLLRPRRGAEAMQSVTDAMSSEGSRAEVERQLSAAAERHREALISMQELGRSEAGQHVA